MKECILITGCRRSGNHAIINWLAAHYPAVKHFNNCSTRTKNLEDRKTEVREFGDCSRHHEVFISCEDKTLDESNEICRFWGYKPKVRILILRSFYNALASRQKMIETVTEGAWEHGTMDLDRFYDVWVDHAEVDSSDLQWYVIFFDRWAENRKYRRSIEFELGLDIGKDGDMNYVPKDGKGSSFDRRTKKGTEMDVNNRLDQVDLPEKYLTKEIQELNDMWFGWHV